MVDFVCVRGMGFQPLAMILLLEEWGSVAGEGGRKGHAAGQRDGRGDSRA